MSGPVRGDDPRGWIRFCLTIGWPAIALFALCAWGADRSDGTTRVLLEALVAITWVTAVAVLSVGYRGYLIGRYPPRLPRRRSR